MRKEAILGLGLVGASLANAGIYLLTNAAIAARHTRFSGIRSISNRIMSRSLQHGMAKRRLGDLSSGLVNAYFGKPSLTAYNQIRTVGDRLAKLRPEERVLLTRRLKQSLERTTYLKKAPIIGDLYVTLKSMPESALLRPKAGRFTIPVSKSTSRGERILGRVIGESHLGGIAAANIITPVGIPAIYFGKVSRGLISRRNMSTGTMSGGFLRGLGGQKTPALDFSSYPQFAESRAGQTLLGTFEAEARDLGVAFRKEIRKNPEAAVAVYRNVLDLSFAGPKTIREHALKYGLKTFVGPNSWKSVAESLSRKPALIPSIERAKSTAHLGSMTGALRTRSLLGMQPDTHWPGTASVAKAWAKRPFKNRIKNRLKQLTAG